MSACARESEEGLEGDADLGLEPRIHEIRTWLESVE